MLRPANLATNTWTANWKHEWNHTITTDVKTKSNIYVFCWSASKTNHCAYAHIYMYQRISWDWVHSLDFGSLINSRLYTWTDITFRFQINSYFCWIFQPNAPLKFRLTSTKCIIFSLFWNESIFKRKIPSFILWKFYVFILQSRMNVLFSTLYT